MKDKTLVDISPVAFDDVDEIINSGVAAESDVGIGNPEQFSSVGHFVKNDKPLPVFPQNLLDQVKVQLRLGHHDLQVDPPLVLLLEDDVGRRLVHPDSKALQLVLQDLLVPERLQHVQHNEDDVCCPGNRNNLGFYEWNVKNVSTLTICLTQQSKFLPFWLLGFH